jgi:hypothetical protein
VSASIVSTPFEVLAYVKFLLHPKEIVPPLVPVIVRP